jgi:hypothetical protein
MHHMTKKSLLAKAAELAKAGASAVEVKNALTQAEPAIPITEIDEIVLATFDDPFNDPEPPKPGDQEPAAAAEVRPIVDGAIINGKKSVYKKKYDIMKGKWHARKAVRGLDGNDLVIEWEFVAEGKPTKTGVPMEPDKAEIFNSVRRIQQGNTFVEQLVEVGSTAKILHKIPNPFEVREIIY